jgi:hypothetical protein
VNGYGRNCRATNRKIKGPPKSAANSGQVAGLEIRLRYDLSRDARSVMNNDHKHRESPNGNRSPDGIFSRRVVRADAAMGFWRQTPLLTVTGLFAKFVLATGQAWARGIDISCGCFNLKNLGLHESLPGLVRFVESVAFAFFRNLILVTIAGFLLLHAARSPQATETIAGE